MAEFHLLPCKVRETKLVPDLGEDAVKFQLPEFMNKFRMSGDRVDRVRLHSVRVGCFVGLIDNRGAEPEFFVVNPVRNKGGKGDVSWIHKRDATFSSRIQEVFRVERVLWDSSVLENAGSDRKKT